MNTLEKLERASALMTEAHDLMEQVINENESIAEHHEYSIRIILQQLDKFNQYNNGNGYGGNTSIVDIIESESNNWKSN